MAEFNSAAERRAEEAAKLPQFRTVNLRGVKDTVAQVLDMIGKVEGISPLTQNMTSAISTRCFRCWIGSFRQKQNGL